jgi:amidase
MNSLELAFTPALQQAELIRSGTVSPLDLVEVYLKRIEALNGKLGSYVTVAAEQAIADARAKTEQLAGSPEDLPPFFGVPISVKDLNPVAGLPCTYGLKVLKNRLADADDGVVTKIKQAGFIILGKTTTSEMGMFPYCEGNGFPPARNPWHLDYTAGGSSGGAASALAAGLCPITQGSDAGGSIRGPAFCCGLVGIKPARGRVSMAPYGDRLNGIATNGPIGRTVADAAALLDVMAGYVPGDPYWLPDPQPSFLAATQIVPKPLRIGCITALSPIGDAHPDCQKAVTDTAQLLQNLGHQVESASLPDLSELIEPFTVLWRSILDEASVPEFVLGKMNRWLRLRSRFTSCGKYLRSVDQMQLVARRLVEQTTGFDVLLLPTYMYPTIRVGEWASLRPATILQEIINWIAPCPPFNATGQPGISIPTGFTSTGLPMGVQLVGRPADEFTLISLAAQIESVQPWSQHRPEIAAITCD